MSISSRIMDLVDEYALAVVIAASVPILAEQYTAKGEQLREQIRKNIEDGIARKTAVE